jgi:hypothetical protein
MQTTQQQGTPSAPAKPQQQGQTAPAPQQTGFTDWASI